MLILRRKAGEAVLIGSDVKVTVLTADDGGVRLAIEAPKEVMVLREELVDAMRENRDAAQEQARPEELLEALAGLSGGMPEQKG